MNIDIVKYAHLIARLAYEDGFRQLFIDDPKKAFKEMDIDLQDEHIAPPDQRRKLASKEILQKEYKDRLIRIIGPTSGPSYELL